MTQPARETRRKVKLRTSQERKPNTELQHYYCIHARMLETENPLEYQPIHGRIRTWMHQRVVSLIENWKWGRQNVTVSGLSCQYTCRQLPRQNQKWAGWQTLAMPLLSPQTERSCNRLSNKVMSRYLLDRKNIERGQNHREMEEWSSGTKVQRTWSCRWIYYEAKHLSSIDY